MFRAFAATAAVVLLATLSASSGPPKSACDLEEGACAAQGQAMLQRPGGNLLEEREVAEDAEDTEAAAVERDFVGVNGSQWLTLKGKTSSQISTGWGGSSSRAIDGQPTKTSWGS